MLRSSTIRCSTRGRRRRLWQEAAGEDNEREARHDAPSIDVHNLAWACGQSSVNQCKKDHGNFEANMTVSKV